MADHKLALIRRRARGRIASVNQLDTATPDGAGHERENRARPFRRPARISLGMIIFLVVLLSLPIGLWLVF